MKKKKTTSDALEILEMLYPVKPGSAREAKLAKYDRDFVVAQELYALRTKAGLTQEQLAKKVGTTRTAIVRLEDADYRGHSVRMLEKIAQALDHRVEIHFTPIVRPQSGTSARVAKSVRPDVRNSIDRVHKTHRKALDRPA